jgi:integrase
MRFGEMAGLHWQRVDFASGFITVAEPWDRTAQRIKGYTKSRKPRRVPIPSWVEDALLARPRTSGAVCGLPHAKGGARCTSPLVLLSPTGKPLDVTQVGQLQWKTAVEFSGVGHVRMHDLRHTYASWLRQDGVDLEHVQELLGHASILTTQRYSHFGPDRFDKARLILDGKASVVGAPITPHDLENGPLEQSA